MYEKPPNDDYKNIINHSPKMRLVTKWTIHPFISNSRITSLMCILKEKKISHLSQCDYYCL